MTLSCPTPRSEPRDLGRDHLLWQSRRVRARGPRRSVPVRASRRVRGCWCAGAHPTPGRASTVRGSATLSGRRHDRLSRTRVAAILTSLCLCVWTAGCATPVRHWQPACAPDTLEDLRFVHYLASVPVVSVDEGMRAVLMLTGPTEAWPTFEDRHAELCERGCVKPAWRLAPDEVLTHGTLAYMLRATCGIPRSVSEVLAEPTGLGQRRYALRTCTDAGVLPYARASDPVRGGELLTALDAAERFAAGQVEPKP